MTGTDEANHPYFSRDEAIELPAQGGAPPPAAIFRVWAEDALPISLPTAGLCGVLMSGEGPEALDKFAPLAPVGSTGVRTYWMEMSPDYRGNNMVPLHWHDSTEIAFIAEGEVILALANGTERVLRKGDAVVITGVEHHWENRSGKNVVAAVVSLASVRTGPAPDGMDTTVEFSSQA